MSVIPIKKQLLTYCEQSIASRYHTLQNVIEGIEASLFEATKSSAGDKHETERAMLQIERERTGKQLQQIEQLQRVLKKIVLKPSNKVSLGSLVYTTSGNYFLSLSVGSITLEKTPFFCVAMGAPITQLLQGKEQGDLFEFQGTKHQIISVE